MQATCALVRLFLKRLVTAYHPQHVLSPSLPLPPPLFRIYFFCQEKPEPVGLTPFSGFPREQLGRPVRITEPAKNVCQTGSFARGGGWTLKWDTQERWENPLMGWASTADPLSNLELDFDSLESAQHFCEKNGWDHYVYYQPKKTWIGGKKSYGAAFAWDKRTRKQTK